MENVIAEGFKGERAIVTPYNIRNYQAGNYITGQLYVTHIGYYPDAKFHYRKRAGGTNENILIYCKKGSGWIQCGEEKYTVGEGSFFIIPANTGHSYGADDRDPWSIYWLHFNGSNTAMFDSIIGRLIYIGEADNSRRGERLQLFDEMYQNLNMGYDPENLEYVTFCLMHFLASLKYVTQYREVKKVRETDIVRRAILYMKDNLENKLTLSDIAGAMGYSPGRMNALFTRRTSFSLMEYYNQLKIQRACGYLQFSDLKIGEIAYKLKYFDPFHFSNAFRKEMEISPREYRRRYKHKH